MAHLNEVAGKFRSEWNEQVKAVVDTWTNYFISLPDFRDAVLVKGLSYAKAHGGKAWIVDSSAAKGTFSPEVQGFIATDVFPAFAKAGIKYFITVTSASAVTKMTIANYSAKAGPAGVQLVEATSAAEAVAWLQKFG